MSIDSLKTVLPTPSAPIEYFESRDLTAFENEFTRLPPDFSEFLKYYGTGVIDGFIWIFNPSSKNPHLNLFRQAKLQLDIFRELRARGNEPKDYSLFPEPDGLLPFGITDNGDVLFWKTTGKPSEWNVVVAESRTPKYEEYSLNMTQFLSRLLTKQLSVAAFPADVPSESPTFTPIT